MTLSHPEQLHVFTTQKIRIQKGGKVFCTKPTHLVENCKKSYGQSNLVDVDGANRASMELIYREQRLSATLCVGHT